MGKQSTTQPTPSDPEIRHKDKFPGICPECESAPGQPCFVNGSAAPDVIHTSRVPAKDK